MTRLAHLIASIGGAAILASCSDSPVAPPEGPGVALAKAGHGEPGVYELHFLHNGQEVQRLPFGSEVILKAVVRDAGQNPATDGSVTFEYCSIPGPRNNINRIDEAPLEKCDVTGEARWVSLTITIQVNSSGEAFAAFCCPQVTPRIGFRFRYSGGRVIASGIAPARDFIWF